MQMGSRPLAIVTGVSHGIGHEVAMLCARCGYDLVLATDGPVDGVIEFATALDVDVEVLRLDLSEDSDLEELYLRTKDRSVDLLMVDGRAGLHTGLMYLIYRIGMGMRRAGRGKIFLNALANRFPPATTFLEHKGSTASVDSFLESLRIELENSGVTLTCVLLHSQDPEFLSPGPSSRHSPLH